MVSPPTTDYALVFPLDRKKNKYDRSFYSPALTDGRMTTEQLRFFLKDVEKTIKKKLRPVKIFTVAYFVFVFFGILSLFTSAFDDSSSYESSGYNNSYNNSTYYGDDSDYDYSNYGTDYSDDSFDSFICSFFVYFLFVIIFGLLLQGIIKNRQRRARKAVQAMIDTNQHIFASQGLRWNLSLGFPYWIELWKDYKGQAPAPVQNNVTFGAPNHMPILQRHQIMPNLTDQVRYPVFNTPTYMSNLAYGQQLPPVQERLIQEQDQYLPPNLDRANSGTA